MTRNDEARPGLSALREVVATSTDNPESTERVGDHPVRLDTELAERVAWTAAVDRATRAYARRVAGLEPWTDFAEILPTSLRDAA